MISRKNSSSEHRAPDDEDYDFSASSDLAMPSDSRKGILMRRLMLLLVAVSVLGTLSGCCGHSFSHGVCDCEQDNHCAERAPWLQTAAPISGETINTAPAKLPEGKKL
jgi:hypothetical protein